MKTPAYDALLASGDQKVAPEEYKKSWKHDAQTFEEKSSI